MIDHVPCFPFDRIILYCVGRFPKHARIYENSSFFSCLAVLRRTVLTQLWNNLAIDLLFLPSPTSSLSSFFFYSSSLNCSSGFLPREGKKVSDQTERGHR